MMAYGWTLEQAMELTFPQLLRLFGAMRETPPAQVVLSGLMKMLMNEKSSGGDNLSGKLGVDVEPAAGAAGDFLNRIGVEVRKRANG